MWEARIRSLSTVRTPPANKPRQPHSLTRPVESVVDHGHTQVVHVLPRVRRG